MHSSKEKFTMDVEVQVAVQFIVSFLSSKFTESEIEEFIKHLTNGLSEKFNGHWYPEKPTKGSAYRCISIENSMDTVLTESAKKANFYLAVFTEHLPKRLDLWIDPSEVSYRIGEHGSVIVIYKEGDDCVNSTSEYLAKVLEKLNVVQQQPTTKPFQRNNNTPLIHNTPQQIANSFNLRQLENCLSPNAKAFVSRGGNHKLPGNLPFGRQHFPHINPALLNLDYLQKLQQWPLLGLAAAGGYDPLTAQIVQNYLIMQELQRFETRRLALQSHYLKLQSLQFGKQRHHHRQHHNNTPSNTASSSSNPNRLQVTA